MSERSIFLSALDIHDETARQAYLDEACAGDAQLRTEVEALLKSHTTAGSFLETPAVEQVASVEPQTVLLGNSGDTDDPIKPPFLGPAAVERDETEAAVLELLQTSEKPGSLGRLAHYEILEALGKGAFGVVLKAFDEKLHRMVAVKTMNPELAATSPPRKRFLREARSSAAVKHEHIVAIYAVEEQPIPYLVMEYVPGLTLQQWLDQHGPLDVTEVLRIGQQIASGLAAAHAQGLIHRDIKPANILLETGIETRAKITDFGLARATDDASLTQSGLIAGTPMYMAPEQAKGQPLDHRADLFSLGSVLYTMVSGRPPFRAPNTIAVLKRVCEDTPRPIQEVIPEVPVWMCNIISKLHAKEPEDRFQTAKDVAEVLRQHLAHLREPTKSPRPAPVQLAIEPAAVVAPKDRTTRQTTGWSTTTVALAVIGAVLLIPMLCIVLPIVGLIVPAYQAARNVKAPQELIEVTQQPGTLTLPWVPRTGSSWHDAAKAINSQAEWLPLFNGRDLTGWRTNPDEPVHWTVENGMLVSRLPQGAVKNSSFLLTDRNDYRDFHVRVEAKINAGGDSGLFFRFGEQGDASLQAQITTAPSGAGSLLRHATVVVPASQQVKPETWFTLEVIAQGPRVLVLFDGQAAANWSDPTGMTPAGPIGFESGFPGTEFFVRKVEVKSLTAPRAPSPAVAPFTAEQAQTHQEAWASYLGVPLEYTNSLGMKFRLIPPGEFLMGSTPAEIEVALQDIGDDRLLQDCVSSEAPQHKVILTQPIYLGVHEVTQAEYEKVLGSNPSHFAPTGAGKDAVAGRDTKRHPVEMVSWNDAAEFCAKLSRQEQLQPFYDRAGETITPLNGSGYRLPSEAEWEFACRAGTTTKYWIGDTDEDLLQAGWLGGNSGSRTHAVGELKANPFGLCDMHGNVWDWVEDGWDPDFYGQFQEQPAINPHSSFSTGSQRVIRGAHWGHAASSGRASVRRTRETTFRADNVGFRVLLPVAAVQTAIAEGSTSAADHATAE